jgi:hypothetical protein
MAAELEMNGKGKRMSGHSILPEPGWAAYAGSGEAQLVVSHMSRYTQGKKKNI